MSSFTQKVREAAVALERFRADDVIDRLVIDNRRDAKAVRRVIHELRKTGEIVSLEPGLYVYKGRTVRRTRLDVIWHLVRSHRQFSTDEIERLSGAARYTVREYLLCLKKTGYLRAVKIGHWQLINDPGPETPVNSEKCKRLKRLRGPI